MNPAVLIASVYVFALAASSATRSSAVWRPFAHAPDVATNAICGISLIGSLVLAGAIHYPLARTSSALSPSQRPPSTWWADSASPTAC